MKCCFTGALGFMTITTNYFLEIEPKIIITLCNVVLSWENYSHQNLKDFILQFWQTKRFLYCFFFMKKKKWYSSGCAFTYTALFLDIKDIYYSIYILLALLFIVLLLRRFYPVIHLISSLAPFIWPVLSTALQNTNCKGCPI